MSAECIFVVGEITMIMKSVFPPPFSNALAFFAISCNFNYRTKGSKVERFQSGPNHFVQSYDP